MLLVNNISAKITKHEPEIKNAVNRVLASGWLILGPEVRNFEQLFAEYNGVGHCVGLANGTDAIELALKAVGVKKNDPVATVANAGMYTTISLMMIGAKPYFLDVDVITKVTTLEEIRLAVKAGVKAVVVTHLYGLAISEIAAIADYCLQMGVPLIEDCAQAHGAEVDGRKVGAFGDAGCFSFYPTKNLGALGDGGAVVSGNEGLIENIKELRQYGWRGKYQVEISGGRNSRLDELQAAILTELLPHLDEANSRRREIASLYSSKVIHQDVVVPTGGNTDLVAHLYVIRCKQRDALRAHLMDHDIASDIHFPIPDHRQPVFGDRYSEIRLTNTENLVHEILTLPCYPEMSNEEVEQVISAINSF